MDIIYRANDGKEFDDELDCRNYELHLAVHKLETNGGIIALDHNNETIPNYLEFFEKIYHIYFINEESVKELDNIIDRFVNEGLEITDRDLYELFENDSLPNAKTWYHWNDCEDKFESDEYKIKQLQYHIKAYNSLLKEVCEENENR